MSCWTPPTGRGAGDEEEGRRASHGRGQQGLCSLPLVSGAGQERVEVPGLQNRGPGRQDVFERSETAGLSARKENAVARTISLNRCRNIGIMAHIDAGKTTATERSCSIPASPTVSARCMKALRPWTTWSRSRSAALPSLRPLPPAHGKTNRINIIDTPGSRGLHG